VPNKANSTWTISGNKETAGGGVWHWPNGGNGAPAKSAGLAVADDDGALSLTAGSMAAANSDSDAFRFKGTAVDRADKSDIVRGLDFGAGDTLALARYDEGTFRAGGNHAGSHVEVDSIATLQALDRASPDVSIMANRKTDVLRIEIDQGDTTHKILLHGLADEFLGL
jgi:hypothetical protein